MTTENCLASSPRVWQPSEVESAWELNQRFGADANYVAGGTLLQLLWENAAGKPRPRHLISLEGIHALRDITESVDDTGVTLEVGALSPLSVCGRHPAIVRRWPVLAAACNQIAAPAVRNRATLGGNVANGCGDTLPALLALDAEVIWFDGETYTATTIERLVGAQARVASSDASPMYTHRSQTDSPAGSGILTAVRLHLPTERHCPPPEQSISVFRKICRRATFAPSLVTVAATCVRHPGCADPGGRPDRADFAPLYRVRLAVGGLDFTAHRLLECERMLDGMNVSPELWRLLHAGILNEFDPPDNTFASADYRRLVAANLLVAQLAQACG